MKAKWYQFRQNNSGGSFDVGDGLTISVLIQAHDANHANARAEALGIYFNGCVEGGDCPCCGDRWYKVDEDDGELFPHDYGEPLEPEDADYWFKGKAVALHPLNGDWHYYQGAKDGN